MYDASLWTNVARLIERAPRESDLRYHGVDLLAAQHDRRLGRTPALHTIAATRTAAATSLIAPLVLQRALAAVNGPVVLMKGPEVAEYYENSLTRPYRDIDLLVEDADAAWNAMVEAGFEPTGDPELYIGIHHLRPLVLPGLPLVVEVHHEPEVARRDRAADCGAAPIPRCRPRPGFPGCSRSSRHDTRSSLQSMPGRTCH